MFLNAGLAQTLCFLVCGVHGCIAKLLLCSDNILDAGQFSNLKHIVVSLSWTVAKISSVSCFHVLRFPTHLFEVAAFPSPEVLSTEAELDAAACLLLSACSVASLSPAPSSLLSLLLVSGICRLLHLTVSDHGFNS